MRARTVAQVKVLEIPDSHQPDGLDCAHGAAYLPDDGAGRLSTLTVDPDPPTNPCAMSDVGVFTGVQNLLYRIEIHDSGQMLGAAAQGTDAAGRCRCRCHHVQVGPISAAQVGRSPEALDLIAGGAAAHRRRSTSSTPMRPARSRCGWEYAMRRCCRPVPRP